MIYSDNKDLRFCKIKKGTKKPFERDWTNKPYTWEEIQEHIKNESNFGVLCGYGGLIVVDSDTPELKQAVEKNLPETSRVKTGSGGTHDYYICKDIKKKIVLQIGDKHFGEVQSYGAQVVGAGSIHPNGNIYELVKDKPICEITQEQLFIAIKPFIKEVAEAEVKTIKAIKDYGSSDINSISITQVMDTSGFKKASNGELYGANKWHGSDTGANTWINQSKNVAHCFRCDCGINVAQAIALNEGIISRCSDTLTKEQFLKVLEVAKAKYGLRSNELQIEDFTNIKEENDFRIARIGGKLHNGLLYWTIPIQVNHKYYFVVLTEDKRILQVVNRFAELKKTLGSDEDIPEDERYFYFDYDEVRYKYPQELFFKDGYNINIPSKRIFELLKTQIDKKKLFDKLKNSLKEYFDHSSDLEYSLLLPSVIITYIGFGLGRTLYTILQGIEDTGKSTLQRWFASVQMNGRFGGHSTIPVSVRLLHFFGASLNQDEIEKMNKDEKVIFFGVANSGFDISGTYELVNTNKKKLQDQIEVLRTFGFKSFSANDLFGFDRSFLSRCYELICTRKNRTTKDIRKLNEQERKNFQEMTDELFVYCLTHYKDIEKDITDMQALLESEGTFGRKTDINAIILGIIKHFQGTYDDEKKELEAKQGLERLENNISTKDSLVLTFIANIFKEKQVSSINSIEVTNKELREHLDNEAGQEGKKTSSRTIGAILRKYNLIVREDQAKREDKGYKYFISLADFKDQIGRFRFNEVTELLKDITPQKSNIEKDNPIERSGESSSFSSFSSFSSSKNERNERNERNEPSSPLIPNESSLSISCKKCGSSNVHAFSDVIFCQECKHRGAIK